MQRRRRIAGLRRRMSKGTLRHRLMGVLILALLLRHGYCERHWRPVDRVARLRPT
jgi:hypothetical protein